MSKKARYQYEITRQGFVDHVYRGDISWDAFNLHHWLRLHCRRGIIFTCAPALAPTLRKPVRQVQRWFRELEKAGYTVSFRRPGQTGAYPIAIHKYETWDGTQALRLNAHLTRDWRKPIYEPVTEDVGETWGEVVTERAGERAGELTPIPLLTTATTPLRQVSTATATRAREGWMCEQCGGGPFGKFDHYLEHVRDKHPEILAEEKSA